jgi:LmbE family N-acetylglucosaminyl deacetylase
MAVDPFCFVNMLKKVLILLAAAFACSQLSLACAQQIEPFPEIALNDRILILAPHPDDEVIGAGGVIQRAVKAGAKVKVALLTYGDNNEFAFIVYEKRIVFRKKEFLRLGEVRRQESLAALEYLGVEEKDVVCLGYPDFGTMEILLKYWGSVKPFKSMLSRVREVPYPSALSFNSPYLGDSILRDLKNLILDFRPTRIIVSHPADVNRDHRALYVFLNLALWDLSSQFPSPGIYPYIIHVGNWPSPRGYHPELEMVVPNEFLRSIKWQQLMLSRVEVKRKKNAVEFFQSQIKYAPKYLESFARKNEIFGDYPPIHLANQPPGSVLWSGVDDSISPAGSASSLEYALQDGSLLVRIKLNREIDKKLGVTLFLLPYSHGVQFSSMPKIQISFGVDGLVIKDKRKRLSSKEIEFSSESKSLVFRIPLKFLGAPDRIFASARTSLHDLTLSEMAWRVLALE